MNNDLPPVGEEKTKKQSTVIINGTHLKKAVGLEGFICLLVVVAIFIGLGIPMGLGNALNTLFNTAYHLLINTCLYLMAVAVVIGALSEILTEFGVISLANKALSPLMKPLFGMPGATSMAILASFLSDNPAVLTLANNQGFRRYFKKYQLGALTNIGTTYGMGLIVIVTMISLPSPDGSNFVLSALLGVLAVF
ncbi:MAG: hypothetical protein IKV38_02410, partial [Clostridia bacterium]|nr:hypothetical protein [Clostridia bacterium]